MNDGEWHFYTKYGTIKDSGCRIKKIERKPLMFMLKMPDTLRTKINRRSI